MTPIPRNLAAPTAPTGIGTLTEPAPNVQRAPRPEEESASGRSEAVDGGSQGRSDTEGSSRPTGQSASAAAEQHIDRSLAMPDRLTRAESSLLMASLLALLTSLSAFLFL